MTSDTRLMLLHPEDDVFVCCSSIAAGDLLLIEGRPIVAAKAIAMGHKVSRRHLEVGAKVHKYGAPIGSITAAVSPGDHVHLHNLASDYLPSHVLDMGKSEAKR
jgi:(2R)-sulfolactate sulfo-lyase subunit alpha